MARILCNVAGGGKPLKGNAETGDVLAGKTFSNKQSNDLTGSMPNQGGYTASKSWVRGNGTTFIRIPKGAYLTAANNGLDLPEVMVADNLYGQGEYNNNYYSGYNNGVSDADGRVNTSSASYNKGVSDADGRVNTSSASYNSGYANGHAAPKSTTLAIRTRVEFYSNSSGTYRRAHTYVNGHEILNVNEGDDRTYNYTVTL